MKPKMQYCDWCGKELGVYTRSRYPRDPESCGSRECERGLRRMAQEQETDIQERAREDGYERYRY